MDNTRVVQGKLQKTFLQRFNFRTDRRTKIERQNNCLLVNTEVGMVE